MIKKTQIQLTLRSLLCIAISDDYVNDIINDIIDDVYEDVATCADQENWNEDDVRLAVGRVLCDRLGIER